MWTAWLAGWGDDSSRPAATLQGEEPRTRIAGAEPSPPWPADNDNARQLGRGRENDVGEFHEAPVYGLRTLSSQMHSFHECRPRHEFMPLTGRGSISVPRNNPPLFPPTSLASAIWLLTAPCCRSPDRNGLVEFIRVEMSSSWRVGTSLPGRSRTDEGMKSEQSEQLGAATEQQRERQDRTSPMELWRAASSRTWLASKCGGVLLASMIAQKIAACCGSFGLCRVIAVSEPKVQPAVRSG